MKSNTFINLRHLAAWLALATVILLPQLSWAVDSVLYAQFPGFRCGTATSKDFQNQIIVLSLSDGTSRPFDPDTGRLTIQRATAGPLKITKDFDGCSPLLFKALVMGQSFPTVKISFVAQSSVPVTFFQIELINAHVQSMAKSFDGLPFDEVSLIFEKIKLTDFLFGQDGGARGQVTVTCDFVADTCF